MVEAPTRMFRALPLFLIAAAAALGQPAQAPQPALVGAVNHGTYLSPTGAFKIDVPVLPELGGVIQDSKDVVTFHDSFGLQISIGAFVHDSTQRWQLTTRGTKDYLIYFFSTFVLPEFKRYCPGTLTESAGFSSDLMDGSLFTYVNMPGGSLFDDKPVFLPAGDPAVAKRGNMIFVKNGVTFVISTELSERITEGSRYSKTPEEEDEILRKRLQNIATNMQFTVPPAPKAAAPGP
jgi:hypothetical protein